MSDTEKVVAAIERLTARIDFLHEDQRRAIEKLNRLRLVVDAVRDEQARISAFVESRSGDPRRD